MRSTSRWGLFPGVAALIAVIALGLAAAGCGSSSSSTSASPTPSSSGSSAAGTWSDADLAALQADPALKAMLPSGMTEIRVASDIPYPPWEYYDPATSKNPAGFDYDLSQAIAKKIGVPASFNETPFDSIILSIKGGKNDMIMSDMYDNLEREGQGVSFVDYAYDGTSILVLKGNPKGITSLDSLAGKTVACESGTTQQAFLQKLNKQFKSAGKAQMKILSLPEPAGGAPGRHERPGRGRPHRPLHGFVHRPDDQQRQHLRGRRRPERAERLRPSDRGHRHRRQEHCSSSTPCRRRCRR